MSNRVVLPSLALPKPKHHWAVGVVIAGLVLVGVMGILLMVAVQRQKAARQAAANAAALAARQPQPAPVPAAQPPAPAPAPVPAVQAAPAAPAPAAAVPDLARQEGTKPSSVAKKAKAHKRPARKVAAKSGGAASTPSKPARKSDPSIDALLRGLN